MSEPEFCPSQWKGNKLTPPLRRPGSTRASRQAALQERRDKATATALADLPVENRKKGVHLSFVVTGFLMLFASCIYMPAYVAKSWSSEPYYGDWYGTLSSAERVPSAALSLLGTGPSLLDRELTRTGLILEELDTGRTAAHSNEDSGSEAGTTGTQLSLGHPLLFNIRAVDGVEEDTPACIAAAPAEGTSDIALAAQQLAAPLRTETSSECSVEDVFARLVPNKLRCMSGEVEHDARTSTTGQAANFAGTMLSVVIWAVVCLSKLLLACAAPKAEQGRLKTTVASEERVAASLQAIRPKCGVRNGMAAGGAGGASAGGVEAEEEELDAENAELLYLHGRIHCLERLLRERCSDLQYQRDTVSMIEGELSALTSEHRALVEEHRRVQKAYSAMFAAMHREQALSALKVADLSPPVIRTTSFQDTPVSLMAVDSDDTGDPFDFSTPAAQH